MKKFLIFAVVLMIAGCDRPRSRPEAKQKDYTISHLNYEGCDYIVFKENEDLYRTVGVVHNPKCKNCK